MVRGALYDSLRENLASETVLTQCAHYGPNCLWINWTLSIMGFLYFDLEDVTYAMGVLHICIGL